MRSLAIFAVLPLLAACTSTSSVPAGSIAPLKGPSSDTAVLRDEDGEPIRLDANSSLRFLRTDGSWTPWRSASELWVSNEGILVPYRCGVADLDRAAVTGLTDDEADELRAAAGPNDRTEDNGGVVMQGEIGPWLSR